MNVFEMEGFLRGKCIPRDILVNESNAEYLVRKLNEAATLKAERDALAVENAEMRSVIDAAVEVSDNSAGIAGWHLNGEIAGWDEILPELNIETPATSAAIGDIEARGVERAAGKMQESGAQTFGDCYIALVKYASDLREAK